jgi:2-hydroxy-6-oxonona-2,4-dienedioate hydrolase
LTTTAEHRSIWTHLMEASFRQGWIDAGGIRTRYVQAGNPQAPALVMLHGTAGSWECFCANLAAHAAHFNCFAFDLVGSGFTDKPDVDYEIPVYVSHVADFMRAVGLDRASLIGVSLGAWIAARFAVAHPAMVEKMSLLAASGLIANAQTMGQIRSVRTKAVDDPSWENMQTVFLTLIHDERNRIPDLVAARQRIYRQPEMKQAMAHILCLQDPAIRTRNLIAEDDWRRIQAPTLLVAAPDDKEDYYRTALRAAELIPDARVVEMRGVAHWAQFEDPETFNRINLDFLLGR